ncbi:glucoamylase/glucan 1,4-alpha-glucosidase-like protein [Decorospora gaudefroyi]|uniref:Glucoamylase n=1 Tax=Decorospora gaudefroyi TaxID=184978 RepID=A0A6A5K970_9PLEO|nr:glucoamylase/glucan 1,4-alpha-glucosidase-like protein [Decorospora gaudefroyi]
MKLSPVLRVLPSALLLVGAYCTPVNHYAKRQSSITDFIESEASVSINGVLANIGSDGTQAPGAAPGIVVASPSMSDPDYFFTWIRDAALTYKALIERFIDGESSLQQLINDYVSSQAYLQTVPNPSGGPDTGGLGEAKFYVNMTAFLGSWGRPQRDGPALRATALSLYANWLISNGQETLAAESVWPVIAKDLAYVVRYWNQTGFDLWEEVNGSSFFTLSAQHRALVEGAALAAKIGQMCDGCSDAAPQILCFLESFWTGSYIDSNINVNDGRTGKDANSVLSSIHTFDPAAACTDATFQPCSSRALANLKEVTDSFRSIYGINNGIPQGQAVAVGRYAEDVYFGGNPWYLTTLAVAEQLYDAIYQWDQQGSITIDSVSLPFFQDLLPSITTGTYTPTQSLICPSNDTHTTESPSYATIIDAVRTYADGYIAVVQKYTPTTGALAEQYNRDTGTPLSARDLTWSYAAFLTATERRAGIVGPTWAEPNNNVAPDVCTAPPACNARVTFNVRATTTFGENVFVVGQLTQLGNWRPDSAVPLSASQYTSDDPLWFADVEIPASTVFEYKYIRISDSGEVTWESDPNRSFITPEGCGSSATIQDVWR